MRLALRSLQERDPLPGGGQEDDDDAGQTLHPKNFKKKEFEIIEIIVFNCGLRSQRETSMG